MAIADLGYDGRCCGVIAGYDPEGCVAVAGVGRNELISYLTHAAQQLHAEEETLRVAAERVLLTRKVTSSDIQQLIDAQRVALRIPANVCLMLASHVENLDEMAGVDGSSRKKVRMTLEWLRGKLGSMTASKT